MWNFANPHKLSKGQKYFFHFLQANFVKEESIFFKAHLAA